MSYLLILNMVDGFRIRPFSFFFFLLTSFIYDYYLSVTVSELCVCFTLQPFIFFFVIMQLWNLGFVCFEGKFFRLKVNFCLENINLDGFFPFKSK